MSDSVHVHERAPIRDSVKFVRRFLTSPGTVGAILPSSGYLAQAMIADLNLQPGDLILEYGPGTGPMTQALSQLDLPALGVSYLGIELDPTFHAALEARFPDLAFHLGSVEDVQSVLEERGLPKARVVISGLPFASLPQQVQLGVVEGTHAVLADDGEFRTFQYVHAYRMKSAQRFRGMMAERFSRFTRSSAVLRNVPPAYVLSYQK